MLCTYVRKRQACMQYTRIKIFLSQSFFESLSASTLLTIIESKIKEHIKLTAKSEVASQIIIESSWKL